MLDLNSIRVLFLFFPGIITVAIIQLWAPKNKNFSTNEVFMYSFIWGVLCYIGSYFIVLYTENVINTLSSLKGIKFDKMISLYITFILGSSLISSIMINIVDNKRILTTKYKSREAVMDAFSGLIVCPIILYFYSTYSKNFSYHIILKILNENISLYIFSVIIACVFTFLLMKIPKISSRLEYLFCDLIKCFLIFVILYISIKQGVSKVKIHEILLGLLNNTTQKISISIIVIPLILGVIIGIVCVVLKRTGVLNKIIFGSKVSYGAIGKLKEGFVKITVFDKKIVYQGKLSFFEFHESKIEILLEEAKIIWENNQHNKKKDLKDAIYLTLLHGTYHIEKIK